MTPAAAASEALAAPVSSKRECEQICQQLENSEDLPVEEWAREMEAVLERMQDADSAVFVVTLDGLWARRRLVHVAAWRGSRAVLEEACNRTPGGPPEAAQMVGPAGDLLLHLVVMNKRLSAEDIQWAISLFPAAASTGNQFGCLPLHVLMRYHESLAPELVDTVLEANPQALQSLSLDRDLPLHCACTNPHVTAPAMCHMVSLHLAAAGMANQYGELPLHLLMQHHKSLTPEMVDAVVNAHPLALQTRVPPEDGEVPLHYAFLNRRMTAEGVRSLLRAFPGAAAIPNGEGSLPYHFLPATIPTALRSQMAKLLMEAIDSLFPCESLPADMAAQSSASDQRYVPPPPDRRWATRKHPLSRQGRLKAGLRVAIRGRENVWQFQTGGGAMQGRAMADKVSLADLVRAGHRTLVQQRLAHSSAAVDLEGVDEAVLRALELRHVEVVQAVLTGASSGAQLFCTAERACEWLGALMCHSPCDYDWLVQWMHEHHDVWGDLDLDRLRLEAAALSGSLSLVESTAAEWQTRRDTELATLTAGNRAAEELGGRAVAGGSVPVLRWLQDAGLATLPSRATTMSTLGPALAKNDRLEMLDMLLPEWPWSPDVAVVRGAVHNGSIRVLRWLHVHTLSRMGADDMAAAVLHGHREVVQFLHRHRNITSVPGDDVLADAVRHSAPGTLGVVEYVLRHNLCNDDAVTSQVLVNACMAATVRVQVVRLLVSRAKEEVLRATEKALANVGANGGGGQAQDVFRAARLRLPQRGSGR